VNETVIAAIFTGLGGVILAWSQMRTQRRGASTAELRELRAEDRRKQAVIDALRRWGIRLEVLLIEKRVEPPERPPQFDADWGREDEEPTGGSKRLRVVQR
jgi:hypothetical protein